MSETLDILAQDDGAADPPELLVFPMGGGFLGCTITMLVDPAASSLGKQYQTQLVISPTQDGLNARVLATLVQEFGLTQEEAEALVPYAMKPLVAAGEFVPLSGARMSGLLVLSGDPQEPFGAATQQFVTNGFLPLSGGEVDGELRVTSNTTADAVTISNTGGGAALTINSDTTSDAVVITNLTGGNGLKITSNIAHPGGTEALLAIAATGPAWPSIKFDTERPGTACGFLQSSRGGLRRWSMEFGSTDPETGGNTGSRFDIRPFADDGSPLPIAWSMFRATGETVLGGALTLPADPVTAMQASTKQYADTKLPLAGGVINGQLTVLPQTNNWGTYRMGIVVGDTTMLYPGILFINTSIQDTGSVALLKYSTGLWFSYGSPTSYGGDIARFDYSTVSIYSPVSVGVRTAVAGSGAPGGSIVMTSGRGDGAGRGGSINFTTSAGGTTGRAGDIGLSIASSAGGVGGAINLTSGNSTSSAGGSITLQTGNSTAAGSDAGQLSLYGGTATTGFGGSIILRGGNSNSGAAGNITLLPGSGSSGSGGTAGSIFLRGGVTGATRSDLIFDMTNMRSWQITALPTADPAIADAIWSNGGVLMQSGATPPWLPLVGGTLSPGPLIIANPATTGSVLSAIRINAVGTGAAGGAARLLLQAGSNSAGKTVVGLWDTATNAGVGVWKTGTTVAQQQINLGAISDSDGTTQSPAWFYINASGGFVAMGNGQINGTLYLGTTATLPQHATNKTYVDAATAPFRAATAVGGSRADPEQALSALLTVLAGTGLITNSTTA